MSDISQIQNFYKDQNIFITGCTGFIGKLLIEKLLRSCKDLNSIYCLIREKRGKSAEERFKEIFEDSCFLRLREEHPYFTEKLVLISGDCKLENLGINNEDTKILIENVTCIFHAAASFKFEADIKELSYCNIGGTKEVVKLAHKMKHLRAFIHVSTAYAHCNLNHVKEIFYSLKVNVDKYIRLINVSDEMYLNLYMPILLGLQNIPNTYIATKAMAENVIKDEGYNLPVSIVRPTMIWSTRYEPLRGWIDNFYGIMGLAVGAHLGILKTLYSKKSMKANIVPADAVVNCILAAAWNIQENKDDEKGPVKIYNCAGKHENLLTLGDLTSVMRDVSWKYPTNSMIWHNSFAIRENYYINEIYKFVFHTCLAYMMDFFLKISGRKTFAVESYKKAKILLNTLEYFTVNEITFETKNVDELWEKMSSKDRRIFKFNTDDINWEEYISDIAKGGRKYLLKDPDETYPQAHRKKYIFFVMHQVLKALVFYLLLRIVVLIYDLLL